MSDCYGLRIYHSVSVTRVKNKMTASYILFGAFANCDSDF